jgi:hypothetical protein
MPTLRPCGLARFRRWHFGRCCYSGLLVALAFLFGATTRMNGHPAESKRYPDHEHQHKDLICRHTPSFFITSEPGSD